VITDHENIFLQSFDELNVQKNSIYLKMNYLCEKCHHMCHCINVDRYQWHLISLNNSVKNIFKICYHNIFLLSNQLY